MKVFKSIMLYLMILIGAVVAATLICCIIMICSPKTTILGYRYISYKDVLTEETSIASGVNALSISSNRMDIEIIPNTESKKVILNYSQGMSGFVKAKASDLKIVATTETLQFDGGDGTGQGPYKTLKIEVQEPKGLIFLSSCYIKVQVPVGTTFSVINAYTKTGSISYNSLAEGGGRFTTTNLYLNTRTKDISQKAIVINNPNASKYHIKTLAAACYFKNAGNDISGNIIFTTSGGKLVAQEGALKGSLTVNSSADVGGANLNISKLYGNLNFYARSGNVKINEIIKGTNTSYPTVTIKSEYCSFSADKLAGTITTTGYNGKDPDEISVKIKELHYMGGNTISIDSERGNVNIGVLKGGANFTTSYGDITIKEAYNNIDIDTRNGKIDITFAESGCSMTKLDITAERRSGIKLRNLIKTIDITAENGCQYIDLGFSERVKGGEDCKVQIYSKEGNVKLTDLNGTPVAVYSDGKFSDKNIDVVSMSVIEPVNSDYCKTPKEFAYQRRLNYPKSLASTTKFATVKITNSGNSGEACAIYATN